MASRSSVASFIVVSILCLILIISLFVSPGIAGRILTDNEENGGNESSGTGVHGSRSSPGHSAVGNNSSPGDIPVFYRDDGNGNLIPIPVVIYCPNKTC